MAKPTTDIDSFKAFLRDRTKETWDDRHTPYYLSYVAIDLKQRGADYREIVGPLKLSQWAASNEIPDTILVTHPIQRARVGFVPADSGFEFDTNEVISTTDARPKVSHNRTRTLIQFVQSLANLPEDAVINLNIPAKTLIALLKS